MKRIYIISMLFCLCATISIQAQSRFEKIHRHDSLSDFLKKYLVINDHNSRNTDTTTVWYNNILRKDSLAVVPDSVLGYVDYKPDYYRLFVPLTYYYAPIAQITKLNWNMPEANDSTKMYIDYGMLPYDSLQFTSYKSTQQLVNSALLAVYSKDYRLIKTTEDQVMSRKIYKEFRPYIPQKTRVVNLFTPDPIEEDMGPASLKVLKPNWWTYGGSFSLQMTQNYVSSNWYKGGESTNTILGYLALKANYNDQEKIQWENLLEAKFGITSAPSDTCHNFLVTNDLLRAYSKLGIQASNKWYYTITGEFNTQFSNAYKKNTNTLQAAFMAPANLIFSVGMDYKLKNKNIDFSLLLSPFAYNLRYVGDRRVDETAYGLNEGDSFLHIFGSKLTSTWTWQIISTVSWVSRLYYFTNYKEVEAEWENTFNFKLNKYLAAQLFVHGRFDDSVAPTVGSSYFQLKEYFSFGISYAW